MKSAEIRELAEDELEQKEIELREELFNLKIQIATGQLENTARIGQVKKDIARIQTVLNTRARSGEGKNAQGQ